MYKSCSILSHPYWRFFTHLGLLHLVRRKNVTSIKVLFREVKFHQGSLTSLTESKEDCFYSKGPLVDWWSVPSVVKADVQTSLSGLRHHFLQCVCTCVSLYMFTCLPQSGRTRTLVSFRTRPCVKEGHTQSAAGKSFTCYHCHYGSLVTHLHWAKGTTDSRFHGEGSRWRTKALSCRRIGGQLLY